MNQNTNYRFCDSMDYLIPPVKKQHLSVREPESHFQEVRGSYVSTLSSAYINKNIEEINLKKYALKTKDKDILNTVLLVDHNKHNKDIFSKNYHPIIKITVVPKTAETQTCKVFNKKIFRKKIKSTCSNYEGFHCNTVYSVSGRKREKIYKIKSSESDFFSNKRFYYFNNMHKNNFKNKRKKDVEKAFNDTVPNCNNFNCPNKHGLPDVSRHKSRVTIVGRLGITNDDKYVLNCAATVDDKPIHTSITQDKAMSNKHDEQPVFDGSKASRSYSPKRYNFNETASSNNCTRTESLGIQVTLNNDFENKIIHRSMKNKYSQCVCTNYATNHPENAASNGYHSPIVVISVYPKENDNDGHIIKVEDRQVSPKAKPEVEPEVTIKDKKSTFLSSVSPPNTKAGNSNNNKIFKHNTSSVSPNRFTNWTRKKILLGTSKTDVAGNRSKVNFNTKPNLRNNIYQNRQESYKGKEQHKVKNIEASRNLAKKALVDDYINKLESKEDKNNRKVGRHYFTPPKDKASKVTVNINSEAERYDLLFKHDRQNTDFSVRKTVKSKKENDFASMENVLILTDKKPPTSLTYSVTSPVTSRRNSRPPNLPKKSSNLTVRDSIEVFHGRSSSVSPERKMAVMKNKNWRPKHYRGDPCSVPDPSERDKEIRQLLGILTGRNLNEPIQHSTQPEECFVAKTGERNIESECSKNKIKLSSSLSKLNPKKLLAKLQNKPIPEIVHGKETKFYELNCGVPKNTFKEDNNDPTMIPSYESTLSMVPQNKNHNEASHILNRNIQVFLEEEQFTKQKPVVLTRKQYKKVKKTIKTTVCKRFSNERRAANHDNSISIGHVKLKSKFMSKEIQTDDNINIKKKYSSDLLFERDASKFRNECWFSKNIENEKNNKISESIKGKYINGQVLNGSRKVVSSIEVGYTGVSFTKNVTYSTPACSKDNSSYFGPKKSKTIHTIFKGHKRTVTPNLGTSCSLYSSNSDHTSIGKRSQLLIDSKKKPLLQRLVSCLIMRSKVSQIKIGKPTENETTKNSSINSYNISTSFAGVEIPSSLYDTSISFYSNHTILPVNKMKRSFFSSVKGFLTHYRN